MVTSEYDAITSFSGGMQQARQDTKALRSASSYHYAENMVLDRFTGELKTRPALKLVKIKWESPAAKKHFAAGFLQAVHFSRTYNLIYAVSGGYLFVFEEINNVEMIGEILNSTQLHSFNKCYFIETPFGVLLNDAISMPLVIRWKTVEEQNKEDSLSPGRQGVFCHNRIHFVSQDKKSIYFTSYGKPFSLEEPRLFNLYGFKPPDDSSVTAIKSFPISNISQRNSYLQNDGNSLVFFTDNGIYNINVSGSMGDWGKGSTGRINELAVADGIGAVNQDSAINVGGLLYFHTRSHGICDLKSAIISSSTTDSVLGQNETFDFCSTPMKESNFWVYAPNGFFASVYPAFYHNRIVYRGLLFRRKSEFASQSIWESVWSGLNFTEGVSSRTKTYFFHLNKDGENDIYFIDENSKEHYETINGVTQNKFSSVKLGGHSFKSPLKNKSLDLSILNLDIRGSCKAFVGSNANSFASEMTTSEDSAQCDSFGDMEFTPSKPVESTYVYQGFYFSGNASIKSVTFSAKDGERKKKVAPIIKPKFQPPFPSFYVNKFK